MQSKTWGPIFHISKLSVVLLALLSSNMVFSQDQPMTNFIEAVRSSPFDPPEADDENFIIDDGPFLDTGCTFRSGGPLIIQFEVTRFVGKTKGDNTLDDDVLKTLLDNKLISEFLSLEMPAFDVDFFAQVSGFQPERDDVYFNDKKVGQLTGENNTWIYNTFPIHISDVKFPSAPAEGGTITPMVNTIRIDIDVANAGVGEFWCTAIDWVLLRGLKAWRPILLLHGFNSSPDIWEDLWIPRLDGLEIRNNAVQLGGTATIQANSHQVGEEVEALKNRYGVSKINIVAHSKGGVDSRRYITNNNDIEVLYQIGTPNAGTPVAERWSSRRSFRPGILDLTPDAMARFNLANGQNPSTHIISMACDFTGNRVLYDLPFADDEIVQVFSAHSLSYATRFQLTSSETTCRHFSVPLFGGGVYNSEDIYNTLLPFLAPFRQTTTPVLATSGSNYQIASIAQASNSSFGGVRAEMTSTEENPLGRLEHTKSFSAEIAHGATNTHSIALDPASQASFQILWGNADLDLVLIDPDGNRIDPSFAQNDPNIEFASVQIFDDFQAETYFIQNPKSGSWTTEVTGANVTSPNGESYSLTAFVKETAFTYSTNTNLSFYSNGAQIEISSEAKENGSPVTGSSVTATVTLPDESTQTITLFDDGTNGDPVANDGVYFNVFSNTTQSGTYSIRSTVERTTSVKFSREVLRTVTVSQSGSEFDGAFNDAGHDSNGNGLFEELRIEIGVDIDTEGEYAVTGLLKDSNGNIIDISTTSSTLGVGSHTVNLSFDGRLIFQNGVDGPYSIEQLVLTEITTQEQLIVDFIANAHTTSTHKPSDFERPEIFLTGGSGDFGTDTDNNGLFDLLTVQTEVNLLKTDFYEWSAKLVDGNGNEIDFAGNSSTLNAGVVNIDFVFEGIKIGDNGVDGPFFVKDLLIFGRGGANLVANDVAATQAYEFSQFERSVTPPTADAGEDHGICLDDSVTIGGAPTATDGTPPYSYSWTPVDGLDDPTASNPKAAPDATTEYTVEVTDANGLTDTDAVTVTVLPLPVADAGDDAAICVGELATIGGVVTASGGTGPYAISWSPEIGLDDPTAANPVAAPSKTTTYTVTVTDANGCSQSDEVTVTVHDFVFLADDDVRINKYRPSTGNIHSNGRIAIYPGHPSEMVGNLTAGIYAALGPFNTLDGDVTAGDSARVARSAVVTGTVTAPAEVALISMPVLDFTAGGDDVLVLKRGVVDLAPGSYNRAGLEALATLNLRAGDYYFNKLEVGTGATLAADVTDGPVRIHIVHQMEMSDFSQVVISPDAEASDQVIFKSMQIGSLHIGERASIRGAILAPKAIVKFEEHCSFKGSICAYAIGMEKGMTFTRHFPEDLDNSAVELARAKNDLSAVTETVVTNFELAQNYPNPFNPSTTIRFAIPRSTDVSLAIFDVSGKLVRTLVAQSMPSGRHSVVWDGTNETGAKVSSGIYIYRLQADDFVARKKLILAK